MTTAIADSVAAITARWTAAWVPVTGVPVVWHQNLSDAAPVAPAGAHWLHLAVEHSSDEMVAFGGGRGANERELQGAVAIRVLAKRGAGETTQLQLLDSALDVFRSYRSGALSFLGATGLDQPGASSDGLWWVRSGIAVFVYRFRG